MKKRNMWICFVILLGQSLWINGIGFWIDHKTSAMQNHREKITKIHHLISQDLECFPVPIAYWNQISFQSDYGAYRTSGNHDGCDILHDSDVSGVIPIVSATDGVITNVGWLYLGGYRIGITSDNNVYYYYAHLDSYAKGLSVGKKVKSGELIGFMGSTGEGEEGTEGKFPVHLHFAIYAEDEKGNEMSVNPYRFLRKLNGE